MYLGKRREKEWNGIWYVVLDGRKREKEDIIWRGGMGDDATTTTTRKKQVWRLEIVQNMFGFLCHHHNMTFSH